MSTLDPKDFGIVGAGPAGIYLSYLLINKGFKVTLYEAGHKKSESLNLGIKNYDFVTKSKIPEGVHRVGGGSNLWKGRISEFSQDAVERLDAEGLREWPIEYPKLQNAFERLFKNIHHSGMTDNQYLSNYFEDLNSDDFGDIKFKLFRYCEPNFFINLLQNLEKSPNFKLMTNSYCKTILPKSTSANIGLVELQFDHLSEGKKSADHSHVVLTGGCMQSTALVLRSPAIMKKLTSPQMVGRGLMEHFDGYVGTLRIGRGDKKNLRRLLLTDERKLEKCDFGLGFYFDGQHDDEYSKMIEYHLEIVNWRKTYLFDPNLNIFNGLPHSMYLMLFFIERLIKKPFSEIRRIFYNLIGIEIYSVWLKGEELRYEGSVIQVLDTESHDLRYAHRVSANSKTLLRRRLNYASIEIRKLGLGTFKIHKYFNLNKLFYTGPNFHPMGTLRMGTDPKKSVTRDDFSLHGTPNVYAINAGIFPNGSNHNPTSMVLALAEVFVSEFRGY